MRGETQRESDQPVIRIASTGTERAVDQGGLSRGFRSRGREKRTAVVIVPLNVCCRANSRPWRSQKLWRKNGHRYRAAPCYRNSRTASCNCCDGAEHRQRSVVCQSVRGHWRRTLTRLAKCTCLRALSSRMLATWRPTKFILLRLIHDASVINTVFSEFVIAWAMRNAFFVTSQRIHKYTDVYKCSIVAEPSCNLFKTG